MKLEDVKPFISSLFPYHFDVDDAVLDDNIDALQYDYGQYLICYFSQGKLKCSYDVIQAESFTFDEVKNLPNIEWIVLENKKGDTLFFREEHIALEAKMKYF